MNNPFEVIEERLSKIETLLIDLKHQPLDQRGKTEGEEILTIQEAAKFLRLSVPTLYGFISKGELPVMKRSKRCYFSKEDLLNYLKEGRRKTISEIQSEVLLPRNKKKK